MNLSKSVIFIFSVCGVTFTLSSQNQNVQNYYPSGELMSEGTTQVANCDPSLVQYNSKDASQNIPSDQEEVNNSNQTCTVKDGAWINYYKSGQVALQANYASGVKTGIWKKYNENGDLTEEINYITGQATFYYPNGQISQQGQLNVNDRKEGEWKGWYEDGSLMYEGHFNNGATINIQHYSKN